MAEKNLREIALSSIPPILVGRKKINKLPSEALGPEREIVEILSSDNPEKEITKIGKSIGLESKDFSSRKVSPSIQVGSKEIPHWVKESREYDYFLVDKKKGNCYRIQSFGWFLIETIIDLQKNKYSNSNVPIAEILASCISKKLHLMYRNYFMFFSRFRDIICIMTNEHISVFEINNNDFSIRMKDEFVSS